MCSLDAQIPSQDRHPGDRAAQRHPRTGSSAHRADGEVGIVLGPALSVPPLANSPSLRSWWTASSRTTNAYCRAVATSWWSVSPATAEALSRTAILSNGSVSRHSPAAFQRFAENPGRTTRSRKGAEKKCRSSTTAATWRSASTSVTCSTCWGVIGTEQVRFILFRFQQQRPVHEADNDDSCLCRHADAPLITPECPDLPFPGPPGRNLQPGDPPLPASTSSTATTAAARPACSKPSTCWAWRVHSAVRACSR